jgi:radical SAM superfamily enzyme YgiQ (UPF0313 family)
MTKHQVKFIKIDDSKSLDLFEKFVEPGPYYTSYPSLSAWSDKYNSKKYIKALLDFYQENGHDVPIHLYVHIPFCAKLCWYCICNISISNDREKIQNFLNHLLLEIGMLKKFFDENSIKPNIKEIHLGGGTPSHLDDDQFSQLVDALSEMVDISSLDEFAMEIDPRTTNHKSLRHFASKGVKRISFGVQDFDEKVQHAINRVQPVKMIEELLTPEIRKLFTGLNFDLLYGLPLQTRETFEKTLLQVEKLSPDRITLLKYAHVPDVRKHMNAIKLEDLPPNEDLPHMFLDSVKKILSEFNIIVDKNVRLNLLKDSLIVGISKNIDETIQYLQEQIASYSNVIFLGVSSGGYAAILFGSLLKVNSVLAFIPQTIRRNQNIDEKYRDISIYINNTTNYFEHLGKAFLRAFLSLHHL